MTSEYVIIGRRPWEAKIFLDHDHVEEIGEIKKGDDQKSFKLIRKNDGLKWTLTKIKMEIMISIKKSLL